jgi:pyrroline-5-carboxylate reductase
LFVSIIYIFHFNREKMLTGKKLAILGVGTLGTALITGLLKSGTVKSDQIIGTVRLQDAIKSTEKKLPILILADNTAAAKDADIIILAIKPQNMLNVLKTIAPVVDSSKLIISAAASVSVAYIEEALGAAVPVVRAMPNTCVLVSTGMTGLTTGKYANESHKQMAESIFKSVGEVVFLEENLFDALTALSASGPAYLYVVIESLTEAGVKLGMRRDMATLLAAQTMLGTAKMILETGCHPALLKDSVTTPAGCTIDGLMELEEGKFRVTLIKAVLKAANRAKELLKI